MLIKKAKKRLGQHFLIDEYVVEKILHSISPKINETFLEIGAGYAALTAPLLQYLNHLTVIEIDKNLVKGLRGRFDKKSLRVIESDVLSVDFSKFGKDIRIVGNLPYNISNALLFHLLRTSDWVLDQHFMLQREVAERLVSCPGTSSYGRSSVMLQSRYSIEKLFDVPGQAFLPRPSVFSSFVRMVPLPEDKRLKPLSSTALEMVVTQAFSQRRKMLRNALGDWAHYIPWSDLHISPDSRAEEITIAEFVALADVLTNQGMVTNL